MKKIFIFLITVVVSSATLANSNELQSLFKSQEKNVTILSQKGLSEIKGGVRSPSYTCTVCSAKHGGYFLPKYVTSVMVKATE